MKWLQIQFDLNKMVFEEKELAELFDPQIPANNGATVAKRPTAEYRDYELSMQGIFAGMDGSGA